MTQTINKEVPGLTIEQTSVQDNECIKFTFKGCFTNKQAVKAADEWKKLFETQNRKTIVVFDCLQMTDYEPLARGTWQQTITFLKTKIDTIWVITDSKVIAAGATIMGMFTSFTIKTVNSESKIDFTKMSVN